MRNAQITQQSTHSDILVIMRTHHN